MLVGPVIQSPTTRGDRFNSTYGDVDSTYGDVDGECN